MFKNYIKIAIRNIQRHKGYSFINIAGLALGMACCILILLWVKDEMATDRFHENISSIYVVRTIQHYGSEVVQGMGSVPALGLALKEEYPEVLKAARISNGQSKYLLENGEKQFKEYIQLADPEIFDLFTFPFIKGDSKNTYGDPYVMVLSESLAKKIFGDEDPINQVLTLNKNDEFRVVGVMEDIPHNSTIRFDIWAPLELTTKIYRPNYLITWWNLAFRTYIEMADQVDVEAFNKKIFNRIRRSNPSTNSEAFIYPFNQVYLEVYGRKDVIRIFSVIAFSILFIACINFMNLSTARSKHRAQEVGMRKVVGAKKIQLIRQFFGESIFFTLISLFGAVGIVAVFMPAFRSLTGKLIFLKDLNDISILAGVIANALATGIFAGIYPALFLSGFRPVTVLKGNMERKAGGSLFRKILVVFQFSLSILLIVGTAVVYNQVSYMKKRNLGFDREHLVYVPLEEEMRKSVDPIKSELIKHPGIKSVSATSHSPTGVYNNGQDWDWEGRDPNVNPLVTYFGVDPDFLETFKMQLTQGESFGPASNHAMTSVLINERFAEIMGKTNVVGTRLSQEDFHLRVIGVVKDFHFTPVTREIGPAIIYFDPTYTSFQTYRFLFIRLNPGDVSETMSHIEKTVKFFNPGYPFEYHFLDDDYDRLYRSIEREMDIIRTFAFLAILISCLGLFGLAAYTSEQRTKEIGIRKILGASASKIIFLLSKQYIKWVLAANLIAWPAAYFLMNFWLQDFPYRINLGIPIFLLAAVLSLLIAQLTVGFQAIKAARTDPVDSLRYE
jgi:predicted permease